MWRLVTSRVLDAIPTMLLVLTLGRWPRVAPYTGAIVGFVVSLYITFEAPLSGMSMNPARTFGSALLARDYLGLWIYFTAPPLGMLLAAETFTRSFGARVICAKLHHPHNGPCIFGCGLKPSCPGGIEAP